MAKKGGKPVTEIADDEVHVPLQAVLLVDSFTQKFRPITLERPKVLLPLVNVPLIDYTLEWLATAGVEECFVFCCAHANQVRNYLAKANWKSQPNFAVTVKWLKCPLSHIPFAPGATTLRFQPKFSSQVLATSTSGAILFTDVQGGGVDFQSYQVDCETDALLAADVSSSGELFAFGDSGGYVHVWGASEHALVNLHSLPTERAGGTIVTTKVSARGSGQNWLPKAYRHVEIKQAFKLKYEEFDSSYYNKTRFAGLENDIVNSYCNALLQVLYFIPEL